MSDKLIKVAQIGKSVGLKGELKLHLYCDFPEQFKKDHIFYTEKNRTLQIEKYDKKKSLVKFINYDSIDEVSVLRNQILYTTLKDTKENCKLSKNEFFWFDIIGLNVYDNDIFLGVVKKIERFEPNDYLFIDTNEDLIKQGYPKEFLIPYIDRYILLVEKENRLIRTKDTIEILKNS